MDEKEILTEGTVEETPAAEEPEDPDFFPLSLVEGMIRRRIVCARIEEKLAQLNKDLQADYRELSTDDNAVAKVDMKAFAEENGFEYHITSAKEGDEVKPIMVAEEIAASANLLPNDEITRIYASAPLRYSPQRLGTYDPDDVNQSWNPPTTMYVYRVLDSKSQTRLEYEDEKTKAVNEETKAIVVEAYKLQKAAVIAKKKADEFAQSAKADGADFDALAQAANASVVETEKFTWFRSSFGPYGEYAQPAEIREVGVEVGAADRDNKEIVEPGWDFYETVFALEQGGVGSCLNQPEDRAFAVQVVELDSDDVIREGFETVDSDQAVAYVLMWFGRASLDKYHEQFVKQLQEKAGFEWLWIPRLEER